METVTRFIGYSSGFKVLICKTCKYCINPSTINYHLRNRPHSLAKRERDEIASQIRARSLDLEGELHRIRIPGQLEVFFGQLEVSDPEYFGCQLCTQPGSLAKNESDIRKHYNRQHQVHFTGNSELNNPYWSGLQTQSLFKGSHKQLFIPNTANNRGIIYPPPPPRPANPRPRRRRGVRVPSSDESVSEGEGLEELTLEELLESTVAQFTTEFEAVTARTNDTFQEADRRRWNQFIINFRLGDWLQGKNLRELARLSLVPEKDDRSGHYVFQMARRCWYSIDPIVQQQDHFLLQVVNTERLHAFGSKYKQRPFTAVQEIKTKRRYSDAWATMISLAYQIWRTGGTSTFTEWPGNIDAYIGFLHQIGEGNGWSICHEEREEDGGLNDEFNAALFSLSKAMITHKITAKTVDDRPYLTNPLVIWCVSRCFNEKSGAFRSESDISNQFSAIIHGLRLHVIGEAVAKYDNINRSGRDPAEDMHDYVVDFHGRFLHVDTFTVFALIQHYRAYARKMRQQVKRNVIYDVNENLIKFAGEPVDIDKLRAGMHSLVQECRQILYNDLLYIHPDEIDATVNIENIRDPSHDKTRGHWFAMHGPNSLGYFNAFLLKRFANTDTPLGQMFARRGFRRIRFDQTQIDHWLRIRNRWMKKLAVLVHLSSGSPVRGTEILLVLYKNGASRTRDLFIDQNTHQVRLHTYYTKTSNITGRDKPTIRLLSREISQLLVHYLVIAHPWYIYCQHLRAKANEVSYTISDLLFEIDGRGMQSNQLGRELMNFSLNRLDAKIGLKAFRHCSKYIIKTRILSPKLGLALHRDSDDSEYDSERSHIDPIEDQQAGHGFGMAQDNYSRDQNLPISIRENTYHNFMNLSIRFHRFFQLDTVAPEIPRRQIEFRPRGRPKHARVFSDDQPNKRSRSRVGSPLAPQPPGPVSSSRPLSDGLPTPIPTASGGQTALSPPGISPIPANSNASTPSANVEDTPVAVQIGADSMLQPRSANYDNLEFHLQKFYKNPLAEFRGAKQRSAIEKAVNHEARVLYINGTNSGKSLVFLLPAYIDRARYHVVFTPLVALKRNQVKRATEHGLESAIWEESATKTEKLTFVSFEQILSRNFQNWLVERRESNEIAQFYVDEAHVIIADSDWRYAVEKMSELNLHEIPIMYLTATMTPELKSLFYRDLKLDDSTVVIRGITKRKNLRYQVQQIEVEVGGDAAVCYQTSIMAFLSTIGWQDGALPNGDLVLVFVWGTIRNLTTIGEQCGWPCYHSKLDERSKASLLDHFTEGRSPILLTTSALALGLDISNIRVVIHLGKQSSFVGFSQESGRAGRDGRQAHSLWLHQGHDVDVGRIRYAEKYHENSANQMDFQGFKAIDSANMVRYARARGCRRELLNRTFDSLAGRPCAANLGDQLCDLCALRIDRLGGIRQVEINAAKEFAMELDRVKDNLTRLGKMCLYCLFDGQWDDYNNHAFRQCPYGHEERWERIFTEIKEVKGAIAADQMIGEGFACFNCYLPMIFHDEIDGCEWKDILVEWNIFIQLVIRSGRYRVGDIPRVPQSPRLARKLSELGKWRKNQCVKAFHWMLELEVDDYIHRFKGVKWQQVGSELIHVMDSDILSDSELFSD